MTSQEARKLADGYVERQRKHDNSFLVRIKKYFNKRKEERRFKRYFKLKFLNSIYNKALQGEYSTQITIYLDYGCNTEFDNEAIKKLKEMGYEVTLEENITNDIIHININWDNKEEKILIKDFVKQVLNSKEKQVNGCFIIWKHNQVFEQYWYENNKLLCDIPDEIMNASIDDNVHSYTTEDWINFDLYL